MNEKNEKKLQNVKNFLEKNGIFYNEFANGQLQVGTVNLWATTEKFLDTSNNSKGVGVNSFIKYLKENNKI